MTKWREGAVVEWVGEDELPFGPKRGERGKLVTSGSARVDPSTGDTADWVVRFEEAIGVYPIEQLRIVESEAATDTD